MACRRFSLACPSASSSSCAKLLSYQAARLIGTVSADVTPPGGTESSGKIDSHHQSGSAVLDRNGIDPSEHAQSSPGEAALENLMRPTLKRDQSRFSFRPKIDPKDTTILLFPGQGSQFVGMGKKLLGYPNVKDLFERASAVLKYDLLHMCLNGAQSQLDKTVHCQAAVFVTSIAALEKLGEEHPKAIENCVASAGFSIGEISALVFAGAISFDDALELIRVRAEAMQLCSEAAPGGLLTVFQEHNSQLGLAMQAARQYCSRRWNATTTAASDSLSTDAGSTDPVCAIANYLAPECKVIGGHQLALNFVKDNAAEFKLHRVKQLPVSGAFHTPLMAAAAKAVSAALDNISVVTPTLPVHCNVDGRVYQTAKAIKKLLPRQVHKPVKWEQTLHIMYEREQGVGFPTTYEVGPGRQLGAILRLVNRRAFASYKNVDV